VRRISAPLEVKSRIFRAARDAGFQKVGFTRAKLDEASGAGAGAGNFATWLERGYHGEMAWMARRPERRSDAALVLEGAATVVCCGLNYYQGPPDRSGSLSPVISSYARGEDYHRVMKERLGRVVRFIEETYDIPARSYVDTGPVLEKPYAASAGLGWLGKHSNLIAPRGSSWFFLGEILLPIRLPPDEPAAERCGTCSRCIIACPTRAIVEPFVVDSRLCISYLTIELRGPIPRKLRPMIGARIYGCDDCQDVCPWNRFAHKSDESAFFAREPLASMDLVVLLGMSRERFMELTKGSAIRRARYPGFLRNVAVALGNSADPRGLLALEEALSHEEPLVRGHSAWALGHRNAIEHVDSLRRRLERENDSFVREELSVALESLRPDRPASR
jgi:epoxyqueuosine reductase